MSGNDVFNKELWVEQGIFDLYDNIISINETEIEIPAVLRHITEVLCQHLNAERATIYLMDKARDELESAAFIGNVSRIIRVPMSESSLTGFCALSGRAFVVPDAYGDLSSIDMRLHFDKSWDEINRFRTRDVMCAPAFFKGKVIGVVEMINSKGEPFSDENLHALQNIARLIGYALYHARLMDDLATLKRLEQEKATFMRIMVHELKSPVSASKMMADLLALYPPENPKTAHMPAKISIRMDQLLELIRDMLELAKVKSGDPLGDIVVLDLVVETKKGCEPYIAQAENKNLPMSITYHEESLSVRFDSKGYHLILSNLLSNAIKYTETGLVKLSLKRQDSWAVLEIVDSGIGIPEADIPKLFKEFFRASNAKKSHIKGSGVGLAGVKHIVERFDGEMELQSRENEGSTFIVRLPLYSEDT
ncbi:MAG: GAF domain-containing sensor histidine kinase [bacterium]|nr:GAF domain-containing sensor histidine kinase [bacterium]